MAEKVLGRGIINCSIYTKSKPDSSRRRKTPYEGLNGETPNVQHFKVFGCDAYAHVPKDERGKLDSKAQKYIFLGYGTTTKGYRLYDDKNCKMLYSRDVLFIELKPSKETKEDVNAGSKKDEKVIVELECMDEGETIENQIKRVSRKTTAKVEQNTTSTRLLWSKCPYGKW